MYNSVYTTLKRLHTRVRYRKYCFLQNTFKGESDLRRDGHDNTTSSTTLRDCSSRNPASGVASWNHHGFSGSKI